MSDRHPIESILILADALAVRDIAEMPGAWIYKVDDAWTVAVNGQTDVVTVEPNGCMSLDLAPFDFAVFFNGWLAGIMSPNSDGVFASGTGANPQEFAEAVDRLVAERKAKGARV